MATHRPDFLVIGAMKCATTTLHEQLAGQRGVFMTPPKEPNYFSDDVNFARGWRWYSSLFEPARTGEVRGESSTHYSKLPTYPETVRRIRSALGEIKLIYVMRHPIDRLVSHYVHEAAAGSFEGPLERAIDTRPELVDYGRYALQLEPYLDVFGPASILPVFFSRLVDRPVAEFARIGRFLGVSEPFCWDESLPPRNRGVDRLRPSPLREALVTSPMLTPIRRTLVPRKISATLMKLWLADVQRPAVPLELQERLAEIFDADLAQLGSWLGVALNCARFDTVALADGVDWRGIAPRE